LCRPFRLGSTGASARPAVEPRTWLWFRTPKRSLTCNAKWAEATTRTSENPKTKRLAPELERFIQRLPHVVSQPGSAWFSVDFQLRRSQLLFGKRLTADSATPSHGSDPSYVESALRLPDFGQLTFTGRASHWWATVRSTGTVMALDARRVSSVMPRILFAYFLACTSVRKRLVWIGRSPIVRNSTRRQVIHLLSHLAGLVPDMVRALARPHYPPPTPQPTFPAPRADRLLTPSAYCPQALLSVARSPAAGRDIAARRPPRCECRAREFGLKQE
jgi:hypothetical protein